MLADTLQDHGLTKGEVLQIVNLAPTELVELYCVSWTPQVYIIIRLSRSRIR